MKSLLSLLLLLGITTAAMAQVEGMITCSGGIYVSKDVTEQGTTFKFDRPMRVWSSMYWGVVRFDTSSLKNSVGKPCTLWMSKVSYGGTPVYSPCNIYAVKGYVPGNSNDADANNLSGAASWNYRKYPSFWGAPGSNLTAACTYLNSNKSDNGTSLSDPAFVVLDDAFVDSLNTGKYGGIAWEPLGTMLWMSRSAGVLTFDPSTIAVENKKDEVAAAASLNASPNPFNPSTVLNVSLPKNTKAASLKIYSANGTVVADLSANLKSGKQSISWNASQLSSGIYFAKLVSGKTSLIKKLSLLK